MILIILELWVCLIFSLKILTQFDQVIKKFANKFQRIFQLYIKNRCGIDKNLMNSRCVVHHVLKDVLCIWCDKYCDKYCDTIGAHVTSWEQGEEVTWASFHRSRSKREGFTEKVHSCCVPIEKNNLKKKITKLKWKNCKQTSQHTVEFIWHPDAPFSALVILQLYLHVKKKIYHVNLQMESIFHVKVHVKLQVNLFVYIKVHVKVHLEVHQEVHLEV